MSKAQVIKTIDEAIESLNKGTWTFPGLTRALFIALKYLVKKQ